VLRTIFTEVLSKTEWLTLIDFLFTDWDRPDLLIYFMASWVVYHRGPFIQAKFLDDIHAYIHRQTITPVRKVIKRAVMRLENRPETVTLNFASQIPLPTGAYPLFTRYPKVI
jgi:hypothetical protein